MSAHLPTEAGTPAASEDRNQNAPDAPSDRVRAVASEDLFQGQRELLIEHAGETYRLRLTRNGKLILNK